RVVHGDEYWQREGCGGAAGVHWPTGRRCNGVPGCAVCCDGSGWLRERGAGGRREHDCDHRCPREAAELLQREHHELGGCEGRASLVHQQERGGGGVQRQCAAV
ncbi:hypothetical protein F444_00480, partial [Phytophthora nicotianae P1976]